MADPLIRVGVSMASVHAVEDPREGARHMIERARAARDAGLDSLMLGDHHVTPIPYYQNVPMMGRLLAEWGAREAGCLFLLPLWNPVLLAEQIGTLAAIAEGPLVVQCALGGGERLFGAMGATLRTRPSAFEEALDSIRRLLAGETVDGKRRFGFRGAIVNPHPGPSQQIQFWIASMSEKSLRRAALVDGWECDPSVSLEEAAARLEVYRSHCAEEGRPFGRAALRRDVFVTGTSDETGRVRAQLEERGHRGFDPKNLVIGEPGEVAEVFARAGRSGFSEILIRHIAAPQAEVLGSFERLADVRRLLH